MDYSENDRHRDKGDKIRMKQARQGTQEDVAKQQFLLCSAHKEPTDLGNASFCPNGPLWPESVVAKSGSCNGRDSERQNWHSKQQEG